MKTVNYIKYAIKKDLNWWVQKAVYYTDKILRKNSGTYVLKEEWDNLIILDNCRYDTFEKFYRLRNMIGTLECRKSRGTWTVEFLRENFESFDCSDIVYITANPYVDKYVGYKFFKIISLWKTHWDSFYNTVLPSDVLEAAKIALRKYPDKRLIIHFLQPHHPYFLLNFEDKAMEQLRNNLYNDFLNTKEYLNTNSIDLRKKITNFYLTDLYRIFELKKLIMMYEENLRLVLPFVEELLFYLPGTTVVTSDHGESFGEKIHLLLPFRIYGHGIARIPSLIVVPWLVVHPEDKFRLNIVKVRKERMIIERMLKRRREIRRIRNIIKKLRFKIKI